MLSWENFPQKLAAPLSGAEPLIKAVNERCSVISIAPLDDVRLEKFNIDTFRIIQNKITGLIPHFVNHLDNGGNWSNTEKGEIAPKWNEADILAAIGDAERIPVPVQLLELSAEWLYQQYKIVNLLIWTDYNSTNVIDGSGVLGSAACPTYPTGPIAEDIENAIERVYSRHWTTGAWTARMGYPFTAYAANGKCKYISSALFNFNSSCDLYAFVGIGGDTANPTHYTYDDGGRGYLPYKWNLLESQNIPKNNRLTSAEYGAPSTEFPKYPPDIGYTDTGKGWHFSGTSLITKFNVPGGFEYVEET